MPHILLRQTARLRGRSYPTNSPSRRKLATLGARHSGRRSAVFGVEVVLMPHILLRQTARLRGRSYPTNSPSRRKLATLGARHSGRRSAVFGVEVVLMPHILLRQTTRLRGRPSLTKPPSRPQPPWERGTLVVGRLCLASKSYSCPTSSSAKPPDCEDVLPPQSHPHAER